MKMVNMWLGILILLIFSLAFNQVIKKTAPWIGAVDHPNERRLNTTPIATLGGLSLFVAIGAVSWYTKNIELSHIFIGSIPIVMVGIIDDIYEIKAKWKMIGQWIGASLAFCFDIHFLYHPFISYLFIVFWFILVMNAFNFLDGIDGLVSGIGVVILLSFGWMDPSFLRIGVWMSSVIVGFMVHNFARGKNKMMLGDTGSMLIGYTISYLLGFQDFKESLYLYPVPFLFLFIILYDLVYVVIDRKVRHIPFSKGEKNHIHHRLMKLGYSPKQTLLILIGVIFVQCVLAIWLQNKIIQYI